MWRGNEPINKLAKKVDKTILRLLQYWYTIANNQMDFVNISLKIDTRADFLSLSEILCNYDTVKIPGFLQVTTAPSPQH